MSLDKSDLYLLHAVVVDWGTLVKEKPCHVFIPVGVFHVLVICVSSSHQRVFSVLQAKSGMLLGFMWTPTKLFSAEYSCFCIVLVMLKCFAVSWFFSFFVHLSPLSPEPARVLSCLFTVVSIMLIMFP